MKAAGGRRLSCRLTQAGRQRWTKRRGRKEGDVQKRADAVGRSARRDAERRP